ncbi:MAG: Lar family restriction alleviation protein [Oscillibacter sp.]|nr:Lar family restriction alleviation protein [Oscillibacter sp.]
MNIHEEIELQSCPYCGGAGLLEEENGWCWYVVCVDCGSQTASIDFRTPEERLGAAQKAARLWNIGKILRHNIGE